MKLTNINRFFKKFAVIQMKYRFVFIAGIVILTVVSSFGLKLVKTDSGQGDFTVQSAQDKFEEHEFQDLFGNNESIVLLVEADDVFAPEVLTMLKDIGNELMEQVPYADSLTSITDMDITIGTEEGLEVSNPFADGIPDDPAELKKAKDFILSRKSIVNKLLSEDAKETWLILSLKAYPEKEDGYAADALTGDGLAAYNVINQDKYKSDAYTIKPAGLPYTEMEENTVSMKETGRTIVISFVCMILLLVLFSKSLRGTLVPIFSTVMGIVTVFGFMGFFGVTVYTLMVALPVVLAMALSVGYSIHLINSFRDYFFKTGDRKEAAISSVENVGWPLLFTVITTVVSLLSFYTTALYPVRWTGGACAATVVAVYIYVSILIPILMSFGKNLSEEERADNKRAKRFKKLDEKFERLGFWVIKKRKTILISFSIFMAVCVPPLFMIEVNMDNFHFMGTRIPYVKRVWEITQSQLGSYFSYNVKLNFDDVDALKDPEVLKNMDKLAQKIGSFEYTKKTNGIPKVFSILDIVKEMNQTMHEDNPEYYRIPDDKELLTQLLFMYEISGGDMSRWVDSEYKITRMSVDVTNFNGNAITADLDTIRNECKILFPNAKAYLVGPAVQFAKMQNKIVYGELSSFLASLVAISILMILVFSSVKMGLIGLLPNLMPIMVLGAIMGYFKIPLDMMTMTIMPMLLGIAVDDTIHFTNHTKFVFENDNSYVLSISKTFRSVGKTLAMTTIILSITFLTYVTCRIDAMLRMGILSAVGLLTALLTDYLVTPALIYITHPFGKLDKKEEAEKLKSLSESR